MGMLSIKDTVFYTWLWVFIMVSIILGFGLFAFTVVSDKGQPTWDYRTVIDVPAGSPYAVYQKLPNPQHIKGRGGE